MEIEICRSSARRSMVCGPTPALISATCDSGTTAGCPVARFTLVLGTGMSATLPALRRIESG